MQQLLLCHPINLAERVALHREKVASVVIGTHPHNPLLVSRGWDRLQTRQQPPLHGFWVSKGTQPMATATARLFEG